MGFNLNKLDNLLQLVSVAFAVIGAIYTLSCAFTIAPSHKDIMLAASCDTIGVVAAAVAILLEKTAPRVNEYRTNGGEKSLMGNYAKAVLFLIFAACIGMAVGVVIESYFFPTQYTVQSTSLTFYLDGYEWANNTVIDWGMIVPDATYTFENFTVANTGTTTVNVTHHVMGLPEDWTQTYTANGAVLEPANSVEGQLILTVPPTAQPGEGSYTTYIYANLPE